MRRLKIYANTSRNMVSKIKTGLSFRTSYQSLSSNFKQIAKMANKWFQLKKKEIHGDYHYFFFAFWNILAALSRKHETSVKNNWKYNFHKKTWLKQISSKFQVIRVIIKCLFWGISKFMLKTAEILGIESREQSQSQ